ncbi:MAG: LytR C-terminal domain-containing protein [Candidatus Krumholzibacteria bacterium]|nr:LytR C-terminal domain-containing protein [Candidatus Krumholzibacteria bacterium]
MAVVRKRKKKSRISMPGLVVLVVFAVMVFSLSVRWSGLGRGLAPEREYFQMEVLNGTGESGIAIRTTMQLRMMGIDVKIEGNADRFDFRESLLIDRRGNPELMKSLSRRLGCRRVLQQIQERSEVAVTLIIGWDRDKLRLEES